MIRTKNLILRTIEEKDLDKLHEVASDVMHQGDFWPLYLQSRKKLETRYEENGFWDEEEGMLLITNPNGNFLGMLAFFPFVRWSHGYEIGGRIFHENKRGQGLMTEAAKIFSAFLFDSKRIHRLTACASYENKASRSVIEKIGFSYEGKMRDFMFNRGEYQDVALYSMLRDEHTPLKELDIL